jgi:hypothetical protein
MKDDVCKTCASREEAWNALYDVKRLVESLDVMIYQATEAGLDRGRILGLLEAASALEKAGYKELGSVIKNLVADELVSYGKSAGEA